jgi:hypothetical protein
MRRALLILAALGGVAHADAAADRMGRLLADLKEGTDCAKASPTRAWCQAATGWDTANMAPLPKSKLLVGMTVTLVEGGVVTTELRDHVVLSAVAFAGDAEHPTIAIHPIQFESPATEAKAIGAVRMVLAGKAKVAALPGGLETVRGALASTTAAALAHGSGGQGWQWSGPSTGQLRKVGSTWIAIEPMANGVYVTLLTDALK